MAAIFIWIILPQENTRTTAFFGFRNSQPLTRAQFVKELCTALAKAGIDVAKFTGHNFRVGSATTAATCGIQDSLIQTMERWESMDYTLYTRTSPSVLCSVYQES